MTLTNSNSSSSDTHSEIAMKADHLEEDVDDDDDKTEEKSSHRKERIQD